MTSLHWFGAGALSAALQALTLGSTVAIMGPRSTRRVLVLVWLGTLLRSIVVAAVLAAAASRGLQAVALTVMGLALSHLTLTRLIWRRLTKRQPAL